MNEKEFIIDGGKFIVAVSKMLDIDPEKVRRIVIDAEVNDVVMVYIQQFGSTKTIDIAPILMEFQSVVKVID